MFGLQSAGDARAEALYLADSWQMTDQFRLDLGVRYEELTLDFVARQRVRLRGRYG